MGYFKELQDNWRPLLAAMIGLGSGFSLQSYTASIMAPHLIAEFGWSRAEFALVGSLSLIMSLVFPFIGRLTDTIGVKRTALIGVITLPIAYIGLSMMTGDITQYVGLFIFQAIFCVTTTATVYSRIVVQYVERSRGLALGVVASGPAIVGALLGPLFNDFVEAYGWRQGYLLLAVFTTACGVIALLMIPAEKGKAEKAAAPARRARDDYPEILRSPAFWLLAVGMLLCNLPQVIALSQLNLVLLENGVSTAEVSGMISAFATGILLGRVVAGVALDRFPAQIVATIALGAPGIGMFMLASHIDTPLFLTASIFLIGLSFGAEGDIIGYMVARTFGVRIYGSVFGLLMFAISSSASLGAVFVSWSLDATGNYNAFLIYAGAAVILGSLLFLPLTKKKDDSGAEPMPAAPAQTS